MRRGIRVAWVIGLLGSVLVLSTGCLFNIFQTARMLGAGNSALTIGVGLMDVSIEDDPSWTLTPQARLAFGLSDSVDLGLQTGALVPLSTGDFGWLGVKGDLLFSLVNDPEAFSFAMGIGAGYGLEFLNMGIFGEAIFSVNGSLPLTIVYQPTVPLTGDGITILHHISAGLELPISEKASVFLVVDIRPQEPRALISYGLGLAIEF